MANEHATITGDKELIAELEKFGINVVEGSRIQQGLMKGARALRDQVRAAAPKQRARAIPPARTTPTKSGLPSIHDDPGYQAFTQKAAGGALRRGIVAYKPKGAGRGNPAASVGSYAPHAWLVEHGASRGQVATAGTFRGKPTGRKALAFKVGGRWFFRQHVTIGPMPAQPYFWKTVDQNREQLESLITLLALEAVKWHSAQTQYLKVE